MRETISKELLSEITKRNIHRVETSIDDYSIPENQVKYWCETTVVPFYINIHELAHKCKEWANKDRFHLISWIICYVAVEKKGYCQIHHTQDKNRESDKPFHADTEPEAIFKACQWILENKK